MKFTFDLFHGEQAPSEDFIEWVPNWWYYSAGFPIEKGALRNGDEWLLAGWFLGEEDAADIIKRFMSHHNIETLFRTDGQFILGVFSKKKNSLEIYRDRIGIFPLVYAKGKKGIAISTWIDNAIAIAGTGIGPSNAVLEQWPVYRKTFSPHTPFESIRSLSGACSLLIKNGHVSELNLPMHFPKNKKYRNLRSASQQLGEKLSLSVAKRIKNQNNLGLLLSGGNDSSLLVALTRKYYSGNFKTVFVTFEDNTRDYGEYARQIAGRYDTDHLTIRLTPNDYLKHWADTIKILQTPLPMPYTIGLVAALQRLSGKVRAVICGQGADTVFGGAFWPHMLLLSSIGRVLPKYFRNALGQFSGKIPTKKPFGKAAAMALEALGTALEDYPHVSAVVGAQEEVDEVFANGAWRKTVDFRKSLAKGEFFEGLFSYLILHGIPQDIATEVRLGLNWNLFLVYPFLDYELIRSSLRMPTWIRYHYSTTKAPLKRYCLNFFEREFVNKPKEGFGVPLSKWFTKREFKPLLRLPLEGRSLKRGWWCEKELRKVIDSHEVGDATDASAESIPWITINLELWARICIEGDSPSLYK